MDLRRWPAEKSVSLAEARRSYGRLSPAGRKAAFDGVAAYLADCRSTNRIVRDLKRHLRRRCWEQAPGTTARSSFVVLAGSPQAQRWLDYWRRASEAPRFMVSQLMEGGRFRQRRMAARYTPGDGGSVAISVTAKVQTLRSARRPGRQDGTSHWKPPANAAPPFAGSASGKRWPIDLRRCSSPRVNRVRLANRRHLHNSRIASIRRPNITTRSVANS